MPVLRESEALGERRIVEALLYAPAHIELGREIGIVRDAETENIAHGCPPSIRDCISVPGNSILRAWRRLRSRIVLRSRKLAPTVVRAKGAGPHDTMARVIQHIWQVRLSLTLLPGLPIGKACWPRWTATTAGAHTSKRRSSTVSS